MKPAEKTAKIIVKYLEGTLTESEADQLRQWVEESDEHALMLARFESPDYLERGHAEHRLFDVEKGYRRFRRERQRIVLRRRAVRIAAAAVIAGVVGAGLWMLTGRTTVDRLERLLAETAPARAVATLVMSDGRVVELGGQTPSTLKESDASITVTAGDVEYAAADGESATLTVNTLTTPRGGEYRLTLSDGTRVWLSPETRVRYPSSFGTDGRELSITGEAYFEVAHDPERPFVINTEHTRIEVLGTAFNVRAYAGQDEQTTLVEGNIKASGEGRERVLEPGDQLSVGDGRFEVRQVPVDGYRLWKNNRFVFSDAGMDEVAAMLERWYDTTITVEDPAVRELRFTGSIPKYDDMRSVLSKLELTTNIRFEERGGGIIVRMEQ